jgi:hypothetical protein
MGAPFLTANDVKLDYIQDNGIAKVNGYDDIPLRVKVSAIMSDTCELIADSMPELCAMIAAELNRQFEAPITYRAPNNCAGWSNEATWQINLAFSANRVLNSAKNTFVKTLSQTGTQLDAEMLRDFAPKAIESLAPNECNNLIFTDVNWIELVSEWLNEFKLNREATEV